MRHVSWTRLIDEGLVQPNPTTGGSARHDLAHRGLVKPTSTKQTTSDGYDRIAWKDAHGRNHSVRARNSDAVAGLAPGRLVRLPKKGLRQRHYHGRYWSHSLDAFVWHESMTEFVAVMLLDHLYDLTAIAAQPMLITFGDGGKSHFPDFLVTHRDGRQMLVDVHLKDRTTPDDARKFELTRQMCERIGWGYQLYDRLDEVTVWNLEAMNRWSNPRYAPADDTRVLILSAVSAHPTYGSLVAALVTPKPGEHIPALHHLMWNREILFDLSAPLTDRTPLRLAAHLSTPEGNHHV